MLWLARVDDLLADRSALVVVAVEQPGARLALQHQRELPGQVVGVLDRGVGAEPVRRRMAVAGVAHAEDAAADVARGVHVVVAPQRRHADRDRDRVVADQVVGDPDRLGLVDLRRRLVDVVAPDDQPLVPRAHHAHQAQADAADVGPGLQHPVEDARAVRDVLGQVGVEDDVHAARHVHLALHRQPEVLGDLRAPAVGSDHVLGPDVVGAAAEAVLDRRGDAVVVLLEREVLGVETHARAALGGVAEQDRLHQVLRDVEVAGGARERVVGKPLRVRAPGVQPGQLLAGEAGAERRRAHQVLRRPLLEHVVDDADVAQRLERALVGDVRARRVRRPAVLGQQQVRDPVGAEEQRRRAARRPAADDQDVGLDARAHAALASCAASGASTKS